MKKKYLTPSENVRHKVVSSKRAKIVTAMTLLNVIQEKVRTIKYGYIANDEFKELRKLIERI